MMPDFDAGRRLTLGKKLCTDGWNHRVDGHPTAQNERIGPVTDSKKSPRAALSLLLRRSLSLSCATHPQVKKGGNYACASFSTATTRVKSSA
jgi:hypothetical protein